MSDAVAIISVVTSGIVGLGGLASTVWSAGRERTWKSREERTIDLRAMLESVSERFPLAMFAAAHMWEDIAAGRGVTPE